MDTIKDIIARVIEPLSSGRNRPHDIGHQWQRLAGGTKTSAAVELKDGILTVHVDCAARLVKFNGLKEQYLEEMQSKNPGITNIRFKVGKIG